MRHKIFLATIIVALNACGESRPPRKIPTPVPGPVAYNPSPTPTLPVLVEETIEEHYKAEAVFGEEYGERCVEYATFAECIAAYEPEPGMENEECHGSQEFCDAEGLERAE